MTTEVQTGIAPVPNVASVDIEGNLGFVFVDGTPSTNVSIGTASNSTHGILANVSVDTAGSLSLSDFNNVSTPETVTVTESTIRGGGLFGNNGATVSSAGVGKLNLISGRSVDDYTVEGSHFGAKFNSQIGITVSSGVFSRADVFVDSGSDLKLQMIDYEAPQPAFLFIHPDGGTVSISGTPNGVANVSYPTGFSSQVAFTGFHEVEAVG